MFVEIDPLIFFESIWHFAFLKAGWYEKDRTFRFLHGNVEGKSDFLLQVAPFRRCPARHTHDYDVTIPYSSRYFLFPLLAGKKLLLVEPRVTTVVCQAPEEVSNAWFVSRRVAEERTQWSSIATSLDYLELGMITFGGGAAPNLRKGRYTLSSADGPQCAGDVLRKVVNCEPETVGAVFRALWVVAANPVANGIRLEELVPDDRIERIWKFSKRDRVFDHFEDPEPL